MSGDPGQPDGTADDPPSPAGSRPLPRPRPRPRRSVPQAPSTCSIRPRRWPVPTAMARRGSKSAAAEPGTAAAVTSAPADAPASTERCADERRIADERCELATRARARADAAADALRLAQRAYDTHEAAAVTAAWGADPRAIHDAKDSAQGGFRAAVRRPRRPTRSSRRRATGSTRSTGSTPRRARRPPPRPGSTPRQRRSERPSNASASKRTPPGSARRTPTRPVSRHGSPWPTVTNGPRPTRPISCRRRRANRGRPGSTKTRRSAWRSKAAGRPGSSGSCAVTARR